MVRRWHYLAVAADMSPVVLQYCKLFAAPPHNIHLHICVTQVEPLVCWFSCTSQWNIVSMLFPRWFRAMAPLLFFAATLLDPRVRYTPLTALVPIRPCLFPLFLLCPTCRCCLFQDSWCKWCHSDLTVLAPRPGTLIIRISEQIRCPWLSCASSEHQQSSSCAWNTNSTTISTATLLSPPQKPSKDDFD